MKNKTKSKVRYEIWCFYNDVKELEYTCHTEQKRNIRARNLKRKNIRFEIKEVPLNVL